MMKMLLCLTLSACMSCVLNAQIDFSEKNRISSDLLSEMDSVISSGTYEQMTSVLVVQNSKLIFENYYQGNDSSSKHNTRSATKSIATILCGIAIDQGLIDSEQDSIFKYLKDNLPVKNPDPRKEGITIEDLLTMSSVLECDDWNNHSRGHEERMYFIEDWTQFLLDLPVRSYPFGGPPEERPYGRAFAYASAKSAAVGDIVERAVGKKLDEFAKEHLFDPLNIQDYQLHYSPNGVLNTAGGSEYRSRDFMKIIQMMANGGEWNEKKILSKEWIDKATKAHANAYDDYDYGYFFWLRKYGNEDQFQAYYMAGNGGNQIISIPSLDLCIVITATNYNSRNAHNYSEELVSKYIIPSLLSKD